MRAFPFGVSRAPLPSRRRPVRHHHRRRSPNIRRAGGPANPLLDKIKASETFNQSCAKVSYLSSAIVDMKLHTVADGVVDPDSFEHKTLAAIGMPRELAMRHRLPQFNHLFSSDAYSAGYYSYLWSETMDADSWAAFQEAGGPWDKATADRLATVLPSRATRRTGRRLTARSAGATRTWTRY